MRMFRLLRRQDASGVSGTGQIAEGIEFSDGTVALRWTGRPYVSTVFYDSIRAVEAIHGHGARTRIIWNDGGPSLAAGLRATLAERLAVREAGV